MRSRTLLLVPGIAVSALVTSCPGYEDALDTRAQREPHRVAPAPRTTTMANPAMPPSVAKPAERPKRAGVAHPVPPPPPELFDETPEDPPEPDPEPRAVTAERHEIASIAKETWVYAEPRWSSRRIGYLRAGAIVPRRPRAAGYASCSEGWYRIEPKGYVCVGATATLDLFDPVVETAAKRPDLTMLPYTYVMSRFPPPPFYVKLPSAAETLETEPDIKSHLRRITHLIGAPAFIEPAPAEPTPGALLYGRSVPALGRTPRPPNAITSGRARARSGFALLSTFDFEGRRFGLTTEHEVIPIDRTRVIKPSTFVGLELDDAISLPVAFVKKGHALRHVPNAAGGLEHGERLSFRKPIPLTGAQRHYGGMMFLEATDGSFVAAQEVVKIDRLQSAPSWATGSRKWLDISLLKQSLVAYEGKKPVYVTLVSSGADGIGDPKKTRSTVQGAFLIHTKHVSATMDDDAIGDEFDFRDVPFVQYFNEGYALHAAYWHDDFGTPRSHGCVNLSPLDAAWLFGWTTPDVPEKWHGALTLRKGTLVYTHP